MTLWAVGIGIDDSGTQTWTVYNGKSADANPYADFTSSGTLKMRYLDGLAVDELFARTDASGDSVMVFHRPGRLGDRDRQHHRRAFQDEITYDPFGNIVTQTIRPRRIGSRRVWSLIHQRGLVF